MTEQERRQCELLRIVAAHAERLAVRNATPTELTEAAALLSTEPSARQPELKLKAK
jgi:hypothetical protein